MIQPPEDIQPFEVSGSFDTRYDMEVAYSLFTELRFLHDTLYCHSWYVSGPVTNTTIKSGRWKPVAAPPHLCSLSIHPTYIAVREKKNNRSLNIVENTLYNVNILKRWMSNASQ